MHLKKSNSWGPFWSYQLNSTANPAHLPQNWAKLANSAVISYQNGRLKLALSLATLITAYVMVKLFSLFLLKLQIPPVISYVHIVCQHIFDSCLYPFFFTEKIKKNIMSLAFKTNHNIFYISLLLNIVFIVVIMKYLDLSFALPIQIEYINEPTRKTYSKLPKKVRVL